MDYSRNFGGSGEADRDEIYFNYRDGQVRPAFVPESGKPGQ